MDNGILFILLASVAVTIAQNSEFFPVLSIGCPYGKFVKKIEWDTATSLRNGIKFHCYRPEDRYGSTVNVSIESTHYNAVFQGSAERTCVLRGMTIISDKNYNDIGLDITSDCRAGPSTGRKFNCGPNQALTNLWTKYDLGNGAMKGISPNCEDVGDITALCQAEDILQSILTCDATQAVAPFTCIFEKKFGVARSTTMSASQTNEFNFHTEFGFEIGYSGFGLSANFKTNIGLSKTTSYNWGTTQESTWSEETTIRLEVAAPPGVRTVIYEVLGRCSFMTIRPNEYRRVDSVNEISIVTNEIIPGNVTVHRSNVPALVASKLAKGFGDKNVA